MSAVDVAIVFVLAVAALRGAYRGFAAEVLGLLAIAAGIFGAFMLAQPVADRILSGSGVDPRLRSGVAFVVAFLSFYLPILLVRAALARRSRAGWKTVPGRVLGAAVATLKWAVVVAVALLAVDTTTSEGTSPALANSRLAPILERTLFVPFEILEPDSKEGAD